MADYEGIYINYRENAVYGLDFNPVLIVDEGDMSRESLGRLVEKMHYLGTIKEWVEWVEKQQKE